LARCQARGRPACVAAGGGRAPAHLREPGPFFFDFSCLCPGRLEVRSQAPLRRSPRLARLLGGTESARVLAEPAVEDRHVVRRVVRGGTESGSPPPLSPPRTTPRRHRVSAGYGVRLPSAALALPPRVREVSRVSSPRRSCTRKQSRAAVARDVASRVRRRRKIRGWFVRDVPQRRGGTESGSPPPLSPSLREFAKSPASARPGARAPANSREQRWLEMSQVECDDDARSVAGS